MKNQIRIKPGILSWLLEILTIFMMTLKLFTPQAFTHRVNNAITFHAPLSALLTALQLLAIASLFRVVAPYQQGAKRHLKCNSTEHSRFNRD